MAKVMKRRWAAEQESGLSQAVSRWPLLRSKGWRLGPGAC